MRTFKLASIDIRLGGIYKKRYLVLILLCGFYGYIFQTYMQNLDSVLGIKDYGMGDLFAFVHCGTIPGIRMLRQRTYEISYIWLTLVMLQLLLPLDYPASAMENWGYPYAVSSSRRQWWIAKCVYTMAVNLIGAFLETASFMASCLASGTDISLACHSQVAEVVFSSANLSLSGTLSTGQTVYLLLIAPTLGIMAMSMVLLLLSVKFGRVTAYVLGTAWIIASIFINHPLLPGNCTMAIRSSLIDAEGISPGVQTASCFGIMAAAVILGILMIRRKDFFRMAVEE